MAEDGEAQRRANAKAAACRGETSRAMRAPLLYSATSRSYCCCRLSQKCGDPPKYRASRNAVSAVTEQEPRNTALMRFGGTLSASARALVLIPRGSKKSWSRMSPGFTGKRRGPATTSEKSIEGKAFRGMLIFTSQSSDYTLHQEANIQSRTSDLADLGAPAAAGRGRGMIARVSAGIVLNPTRQRASQLTNSRSAECARPL